MYNQMVLMCNKKHKSKITESGRVMKREMNIHTKQTELEER